MQDYDAKLGIYSEKSILTEKLENSFRDKYLEAITFNDPKAINLTDLNYLIINLLDNYKSLNSIKSIVSNLNCKIIVLLPLNIKNQEKFVVDTSINDLLEFNNNIGFILVPEILGVGVKFNEMSISHGLIMQTLLSERIKINNSISLINTITINKLVNKIVKETFSFGISGQILALVGPRCDQKTFLMDFLGVERNNIILTNTKIETTEVTRTVTSEVMFSLKRAVINTKKSFLENLDQNKNNQIVIEHKPKKKLLKINLAKVIKIIFLFSSLFIFPLVLLLISIIFLVFSIKTSLTNTKLSERLINYSLKTVSFTEKISFGIPFYYNYSNILYKTSFLLNESLELSKIGNEFVSKAIGKEEYDLGLYSDNISATLDRIYTDIGFLQSDINELNDVVGMIIKNYLNKSNIEIGNYKNKIYQAKSFTSRLATLLGMDKPTKYLILFQNNMELRPTGGFIGSFATILFDKGRLTEIVVNDVYSADGQLKGHVDPPDPIRMYLGEGGWYMRDANWDPSFPESASKIEWFLEKETNNKVDGVIAIDLNFVQKLLKITGPIFLTDFDKTISAENLYANTQNEVESNFFPGSIKKASFLTSLAKQLMVEIQSINSDKYFALIKEIYLALEERHLQFYLHDFNAQESIYNLGYAGKLNLNIDCGIRCFEDDYSVVDANVGVNKSNIYIKRSQVLKFKASKKSIQNELLVTYQNTASQSVGNSGVYKSYTRVLVPKEASIVGVRLYDDKGNYEDIKYDKINANDRQEIGFLINILPGDTKRVQIVWNIDSEILANGGEIKLKIIKQAGTGNDNLNVMFESSDLNLTHGVPSVYTTTLERDFSLKLFLKP